LLKLLANTDDDNDDFEALEQRVKLNNLS